MRTTRLNAVAAVHAEPRPLFEVLVVYEDFAAGLRANDICSFLLAQLGDEFELRSEMWKFEMLRNPKLAEIAAAEAIDADVIIVAMHGTMPLPAEVTSWIDQWTPLRGERAGAFIALLGGSTNPGHAPSPVYAYFQSIAAKANMDFLPHLLALAGNDSPSIRIPLPAEINSPARWDDLMQRPAAQQHWGINE